LEKAGPPEWGGRGGADLFVGDSVRGRNHTDDELDPEISTHYRGFKRISHGRFWTFNDYLQVSYRQRHLVRMFAFS
jgi:hypothetical protein